MKRTEALALLAKKIVDLTDNSDSLSEKLALDLLDFLEKDLRMGPPYLEEIKCQAISDTYYDGYPYRQWDEKFEQDPKLVAAYNKRMEWRKKHE